MVNLENIKDVYTEETIFDFSNRIGRILDLRTSAPRFSCGYISAETPIFDDILSFVRNNNSHISKEKYELTLSNKNYSVCRLISEKGMDEKLKEDSYESMIISVKSFETVKDMKGGIIVLGIIMIKT